MTTRWTNLVTVGLCVALAGCGAAPPGADGGSDAGMVGADAPIGPVDAAGHDAAVDGAGGTNDAAGDTGGQPALDLAGTWVSAGDCEAAPDGMGGTMHFRRTFGLSSSEWTVDFAVYADATCSDGAQLFVATIGGPYTLLGPSSVAPGAREAEFAFAHRTVTARNAGAVGFLNTACGRTDVALDTPVDVNTSGCPGLGIYPSAVCTREYDVVRRDGDNLFFGARPADGNLCTAARRPTMLGSTPVVRRASEAPAMDLVGRWASASCEAMPNGAGGMTYFKRDFALTLASWSVAFTVYGDATCTEAQRQFTANLGGPYALTGVSTVAPGAHEAEFAFAHRLVTAHSAGAASFLDGACGRTDFAAGTAVDVNTSGCAGLGVYPSAVCTREYDVVRRDGDNLFFGARPADGNLCTAARRPAMLGSTPVVRH